MDGTNQEQDKRELSQNLRETGQNEREDGQNIRAIAEQATIVERLDNLIETNRDEHEKIINQTTKTNGRLNEIEKWKERVTGGLIVINIFVIPVIMFLLYERLTRGR